MNSCLRLQDDLSITYTSLSGSLPTCLPACLPAYLYLSTYLLHLPTYSLSAHLPAYLPTCLPTCPPTYVPTYICLLYGIYTYTCLPIPAYLPAYLPIYLSTSLPVPAYLSTYTLAYTYSCQPTNQVAVHTGMDVVCVFSRRRGPPPVDSRVQYPSTPTCVSITPSPGGQPEQGLYPRY